MPDVSDFSDDIDTVSRIEAVPSILNMVKQATGMRFAAIARVTESRWVACAVDDDIEFGLEPGGELPVETTLCHEIRQHLTPVVFTHASEHPVYSRHHTPLIYQLESYVSLPIITAKGDFFGTLCAIDAVPAHFDEAVVLETLKLYAQLIAMNLDLQNELQLSNKALADANEIAHFRDQFVAVLGHDLRSPLTAVRLSADLLASRMTNERDLLLTQAIQQSSVRMGTLIENVLDFARGKLGGGITVEPRRVENLMSQLRGVIDEVCSAHPQASIVETPSISGDDECSSVECDPVRVCQLLSNLLENAITHGLKGAPVELQILVARGELAISVINQGSPIPPELIPMLFQPFSRSQGKQRGEGLGLGLYIASEICAGHGGTLEVISTALSGTRFTAIIPCGGTAQPGN